MPAFPDMKRFQVFSAMATFGLAACGNMNRAISGGDFDPLGSPGGMMGGPTPSVVETFRPGQYVRSSMNNTGFYRVRPRGDADADRLLQRNTRMRVVSVDPSYVRVELDTGEVGFVPSVMVEDPSATRVADDFGNEFQVFPAVEDSFDPTLPEAPEAMPVVGSEPGAADLELPAPPLEDELVVPPVSIPLPEPAAGSDDPVAPADDEEIEEIEEP